MAEENQLVNIGAPETTPGGPNFIERLPSDILLKIFPLADQMEREDLENSTTDTSNEASGSNQTSTPQIPLYLRLAQVCRKWRAVVVEHPPFWSRIETATFPRDKIETFLKNSEGYSLSIKMSFGRQGHTTPGIVELIQAQAGRIREWEVIADGSDAIIVSGLRIANCPILQTLALDIGRDLTESMEHIPTYFSHEKVFSKEIETLRSLTLKNKSATVAPNSWFTHLTNLNLSDMELSSQRLFHFLRLCHDLQELHLSNIFGIIVGEPAVTEIQLPSLRRLDLDLDERVCNYLLRCFRFPDNTEWDITARAPHRGSAVPQNLPIFQNCEELHIKLGKETMEVFSHPRAHLKYVAKDFRQEMHHNNGLVWAMGDFMEHLTESRFRELSRMIPRTFLGVTDLHFTFTDETIALVAKEDWKDMLPRFHNLRSLRFKIAYEGHLRVPELQLDVIDLIDSRLSNGALQYLEFNRFFWGLYPNNFVDRLERVFAQNIIPGANFEFCIREGRNLDLATLNRLPAAANVHVIGDIVEA